MKTLLEFIIRKRNPVFRFDPNITGAQLWATAWHNARARLRGYKLLWYGKAPKQVLLGRRVQLAYAHKIQLGRWVRLGDHCYLSGLGRGLLCIGNNVSIGAYSRVVVSTSLHNIGHYITIENNVGIGEFAYLGGGGGLQIGADCIIGQYFSCHPENHVYEDEQQLIRLQGVTRKGIKIGSNCWIGSKVTICDGVTIGDHCVLAAGAVVTCNVPAHTVVGGVPARVIKQRATRALLKTIHL